MEIFESKIQTFNIYLKVHDNHITTLVSQTFIVRYDLSKVEFCKHLYFECIWLKSFNSKYNHT